MRNKRTRLIIKGMTYECKGLLVLCTETTCLATSKKFNGVVLKSANNKYPVGHYSEEWLGINFTPVASEDIQFTVEPIDYMI